MPTRPIDVTVAWGRPRGPLDMAMSDWWESIFQDMVPAHDGSRLYFLFDKSQEEPEAGIDYHALLVFDPQQRRFVREIPLPIRGCQSKFMYLTSPDTIALFTQTENRQGPGYMMTLYSIKINPDGISIGECKPVLGPLLVGEEYIAAQWQDSIILLSGPAMTVWRVSLTQGVQSSYTVPGSSMKYYYDAVVGQNGVIYLFATRQEGTFDFAQVHTVDIEGRTSMQPFNTYPDQNYGFPPLRKQCALATWKNRLYIAGGEYEDPQRGGQTVRLDDFWYLELTTFVWQKVQVQLPYRMIEPRMHALDDGQCYLWSDCDNSSGCYSRDKHIHVVHLWLGAPTLQEHAWRSVCETNPHLLTANVDYLRQFYRLPEKFLWRVYMAQLGPPSGAQPMPPGYQQPPPAYSQHGHPPPQPPPGFRPDQQQQPQQQPQAWGTAPGYQNHGGGAGGGGGGGGGHKGKKDCSVS